MTKQKILSILKEFEQQDYKKGGVSIAPEMYNAIADKIMRELTKREIKIITHNLPLYKLPFKIKLWWAKQMMKMFRGVGETFPNDIILYTRIESMIEELDLWIRTDGRPTTSNVNYQINKIKANE